jgi:hypothetical protein
MSERYVFPVFPSYGPFVFWIHCAILTEILLDIGRQAPFAPPHCFQVSLRPHSAFHSFIVPWFFGYLFRDGDGLQGCALGNSYLGMDRLSE